MTPCWTTRPLVSQRLTQRSPLPKTGVTELLFSVLLSYHHHGHPCWMAFQRRTSLRLSLHISNHAASAWSRLALVGLAGLLLKRQPYQPWCSKNITVQTSEPCQRSPSTISSKVHVQERKACGQPPGNVRDRILSQRTLYPTSIPAQDSCYANINTSTIGI